MQILTRIQAEGHVYMAQNYWVSDCRENIKVYGSTRDEALATLHKRVISFIETSAREYIDAHSSSRGKINCPQAFILLPIDMWHCKYSDIGCSLQGQLDTLNPSKFFELCSQPEDIKKQIVSTIQKGQYKGFHHLPGRYKCTLCQKPKMSFNYHYPWELTHIADHCDIIEIWKDKKRACNLITNGLPLSALSGSLCNDCFKKVAKLFPEIKLEEYVTIVYEYHRS